MLDHKYRELCTKMFLIPTISLFFASYDSFSFRICAEFDHKKNTRIIDTRGAFFSCPKV